VFETINGVRYHLWRAVDHVGDELSSFAEKRRDKKAARIAVQRLSPSGADSARPDHCRGRGLSETIPVCLTAPLRSDLILIKSMTKAN
jgi:hypothetical protein